MQSQVSSYRYYETLWMLITIPFMILVMPRLVKFVVPLALHYRRRADKSSLEKQIVEHGRELAKVSQVDEFAKYSKIQRKMRISLDTLKKIQQKDMELKIKYSLVANAFAWLVAMILSFRLIYKLYTAAVVGLNLA